MTSNGPPATSTEPSATRLASARTTRSRLRRLASASGSTRGFSPNIAGKKKAHAAAATSSSASTAVICIVQSMDDEPHSMWPAIDPPPRPSIRTLPPRLDLRCSDATPMSAMHPA
eukprot:3337301-Prymnesium_polylepis.1